MIEATLVCWVREVLKEILAIKELPECLVSPGQKGVEVHRAWMVSKVCLGNKEDPGFRDTKESLGCLAFQG